MKMPQFETERLIVRDFVDSDLETRRQMLIDAFGAAAAPPLEESADWMTWTRLNVRELARIYQPPFGDRAIVLKESGALIGSVGLVAQMVPWGVLPDYRAPGQPPHTFTSSEFGLFWAIESPYRGNAYAAEAAQPMIAFVFETLRARRVVAKTERLNLASQRVMIKLGMTIHHNPGPEPFWLEVVGVVNNPKLPAAEI